MLEKDKIREANNAKIVNKTLRKAIMARTRLQNKFLEEKTEQYKKLYNRRWTFCVSLLWESIRNYLSHLNYRIVTIVIFGNMQVLYFLKKYLQGTYFNFIRKLLSVIVTKPIETFNCFLITLLNKFKMK